MPMMTDSPLSQMDLDVLTLAVFEPGEWSAMAYAKDLGIKNHIVNWHAQGCTARGLMHPPGWRIRRPQKWTEIDVMTLGLTVGRKVPERIAVLLNWLQTREGYAATSAAAHAFLITQGEIEEVTTVTATDRLLRGMQERKVLWPPRSWVATALGAKVLFEHKPELQDKLEPLEGHIAPTTGAAPAPFTKWVHLKGSEYVVVGQARLQVSGPHDNEEAVIYKGADGQLWCRPLSEFTRRFKPA